ncbi:MAG: glycoside hydrolase family 95 protein, partial [Bacteroidaceae bacterium]|nr:glycoside hydrolase family 95 protein [Bacteroidaceae bacterium]
MKRKLTFLLFASLLLGAVAKNRVTDRATTLMYKEPASQWVEALPLGNGRLGAMVYGGVDEELLQLNEETLWSGRPVDLNPNPDAVTYLDDVRSALFAGDWKKGQELCRKMQGNYTESYLPMADLKVDFRYASASPVSAYKRELDVAEAVSRTVFERGGVTYTREVFASHPAQVVVVKFSADKKGMVSFAAALSSQLPNEVSAADDGKGLVMSGQAPVHVDPSYLNTPQPVIYERDGHKGMRFAVGVSAVSSGGSVSVANGVLEVKDADMVVLFISGATSFNGMDKD